MIKTPIDELTRYACRLTLEDVPDDVVRVAKQLIIDTFGCIVGSQKTEIGPIVLAGSAGFGLRGSSHIVGRHERTSPLGAAYCNGRLGNAMDFDDTHASGIHLATGVVSGALSHTGVEHQSGSDFLLSVIAGYEVGGRFARAFGPFFSEHEMGPILSGDRSNPDRALPRVWSLAAPLTIGAAAAAARSMSLSASELVQAIAASLYNAPLLQGSAWTEDLADLPNSKYCDAGMCSLVGVHSALMALTGTTSFPALIDGDATLLRLFGDRGTDGLRFLSSDLGSDWMIRNATIKPWPSCRLTHQFMTALEQILLCNEIEAEQIDRIVVETNKVGCIDRFTQKEATSFVSRQFSIPHMIAMQIMRIPPGPRWMEADWPQDGLYRCLTDKVHVEKHPRGERFHEYMTDNEFRQIPGAVRVVCGATEYYRESDFALGDPWTESTTFSDERVDQKFADQVQSANTSELLENLREIERLQSISNVLDMIADAAKPDRIEADY